MIVDRTRLVSRCVFAGLIVVLACALVHQLALDEQPPAEQGHRSSRSSTTAASAELTSTEPAFHPDSRSAATSITVVARDAADGRALDGVRCESGPIQRTVVGRDLRLLATTAGGRAEIPMTLLAANRADAERLVLRLDGYLPNVLPIPAEAGVIEVPMHRGHRLTVAVVDEDNAPVGHAQVSAWTNNIDCRLHSPLKEGKSGESSCTWSPGTSLAWYATAACGDDGCATLTVPPATVHVVASRLGWFPATPRLELPYDPGTPDAQVVMKMRELSCAVFATRGMRVLGRTLPKYSVGWDTVINAAAADANEAARSDLIRRFPGDLVFVCCVAPRLGKATVPPRPLPELHVGVLADGLGRLELRAPMQSFSSVSLQSLPIDLARATEACGRLSVDAVASYPTDVDAPIYAVLAHSGSSLGPIALELRPSDSVLVPVANYEVFAKALGPGEATSLGTFQVSANTECRIDLAPHGIRWPVVMSIADDHGASPSLSRWRLVPTGEDAQRPKPWTMSPRNSDALCAHLIEGTYDWSVSCDGRSWTTTTFEVSPGKNHVRMRLQW